MRSTTGMILAGLLLLGGVRSGWGQDVPPGIPEIPKLLPEGWMLAGPDAAKEGGKVEDLPEVPGALTGLLLPGLLDSPGEASARQGAAGPRTAGDREDREGREDRPSRSGSQSGTGGQSLASREDPPGEGPSPVAGSPRQASQGETIPGKPVGEAPEREEPREIVIGFGQRSVLTPKGALVIEPSLSYTHSSSTRVAIEGFTIIPAIAIGLINVSEVQRDTLTGALAFRYGLFHRLEMEVRVPYVYKTERVRERRAFKATAVDVIRDSEGHALGDVELALRFQFNRGLGGWPFFIGNLRAKSDTGTDPFEVERQELVVEDDDGNPVVIGEVFEEQPTGTGFWAVEPSVTMIAPSDPAVFYSNISYLWNIEREVNDDIGRIDPGDAVGLSVGMGVGLNERPSFSLGYDHTTVFKTTREHDSGLEPRFDYLQVGSFQFGFSAPALNLSLAIGATSAAPDVQLEIRRPFRLF